MPWSGGTFTLLYDWVARRDAGSPTNKIGATEMLAQEQDLADGLEATIKANGDITATADLPMGGFKHSNVGAATSRTNYARAAEVQDGTVFRAASPGGTIDAMTGTIAPAPSAYATGMIIIIVAPGSGSNTVTNPTLNVNSLGTKTIRKHQGVLAVGDYTAGDLLVLLYDGTGLELLNPKYPASSSAIDLSSLTTDTTGGAAADFVPFVDASESNASNKVAVTDFFTNGLGAQATDTSGGATGDLIPFLDASESNAANKVTIDNLLLNSLQLLTTDSTGGATADFIPFVDASDSNAGNKVTVTDLFYNAANNFTADTAPEQSADHVVTRDNSASAPKKVLLQYIGVGKQPIWIPAGAMKSRTTSGAAAGSAETTTNKVMISTFDFDASTIEYVQFQINMPKNWNEGTVTAVFVWSHASTATNFNVVWGIQGLALSDDDAADTAFGTAQTVTDTGGTTNDIYRSSETSAVTIGNSPAENDLIIFQVYRDATNGSDTLAIDARLHGVMLFYTTDVNTVN